jgi:hypothetical protein
VVVVMLGLVETSSVSYWFTPLISSSQVDYCAVALLCLRM